MLWFGVAALAACWIKTSTVGYINIEHKSNETKAYQYKININNAAWYEFALLEGIGPTYSQRIVEYRETNGPFESIDELKRVNGIGDTRLERMRPWLTLGNENTSE